METRTVGDVLDPQEVLQRVPQQEPFRFIDEIVELDAEHIVARHTFSPDADFYRGHFPGDPITPGVILIETAAQASVVAFGIYLWALETSREDHDKVLTIYTDCSIDYSGDVKPGDRVQTTGRLFFYRRKKLRATF
jgi:3-hydroxyacyl-[acyl-carrier-protein] dehydratase